MIEAVLEPIEGALASIRRRWSDDFKRKRCPGPTYPTSAFHARDAASEFDGRLVWEFLWRSELS
ncbi:hypothetical protein GCM10011497_37830 [Elstera cyanobacteriorum]|nr:hypothetical protein GCM10011497_37830 [Elstera cyanobacteriorum]